MPKIGSVKVSYRRSLQPRQYESAEASVQLDLLFDESERPDVDEVISTELDRVQHHVEARLGIGTKTPTPPATPTNPAPAKPAAKPAASKEETSAKPAAPKAAPAPGAKPPAPKPAAAAPKPAAPVPAAAPKAAEGEAKKFTKGDMMKAISNTMTALQKKGITDGNDRINKLVAAYLPDAKPPISYARIPEDSWGDFISDVEKLKDANE